MCRIGKIMTFKNAILVLKCLQISNVSTDLLHIRPAPNNGTHGSLNHLLKKPFYNPSHAKENSSPSSCPVSHLTPIDDLGCTCKHVSRGFWDLLIIFVKYVLFSLVFLNYGFIVKDSLIFYRYQMFQY